MQLELQRQRQCTDYKLAVCMLASGSKGNAVYVSNGSSAILLDAGLSGAEVERRLRAKGLSPRTLRAIVVSHEHYDHIQAVGVLSRRYQLPVYISGRLQTLRPQLGQLHAVRTFECGLPFWVDRFHIHPFTISHDAVDPAGFTVSQDGVRMGLATDLGIVTTMVKEHLKGCGLLILEANHDPDMLLNGPYPWPIKQRIKSRCGHLSNAACKGLLQNLQHDHLKQVILAHLSEVNNTAAKAFAEVTQGLTRCTPRVTVARQDVSSPVIYLK